MKVQIEENLFIESDTHNFMIREYKTRNDGKAERVTTHGYFLSLAGAAKHLVKMKVKQSTATTLQELVSDIQRIEEYIHSKISL
ncbi:hypothetical protein [Paenibacillus sp. MBLB4367]|uniref:hypothetical protein n=1 Tax=Paenibacillus sp. MBLB4367 TaxID=3384767 RepID=UPI0039082CA4